MPKGFRQGRFTPRYPKKYRGNPSNIVFRSSWELDFCRFLDNNPNMLEWASEEIPIPYIKPTDGRVHRYYPDFWIKYKNKNGKIVQEIIEIKPSNQVKPPKKRGKRSKRFLAENLIYAINAAKWKSASDFCRKYGITFRILSEKDLFR